MLSVERVEGRDVEDIPGRELVVSVGGGIRRIVGSVRVGEIAHRKGVMQGEEKRERDVVKGECRVRRKQGDGVGSGQRC